jgi:intraflagellar transport protein 172
MDGSIWVFSFDDGAGARLCTHSCVPYALSWGAAVVAAGSDRKVAFYNAHSRAGNGAAAPPQVFDYGSDETVREFASAAFNPAGETVAVSSRP